MSDNDKDGTVDTFFLIDVKYHQPYKLLYARMRKSFDLILVGEIRDVKASYFSIVKSNRITTLANIQHNYDKVGVTIEIKELTLAQAEEVLPDVGELRIG